MKRSNTSSAGAAKPMAWNPQASHQEGGRPHQQQAELQQLAAQPVAEMAEDDAAQRPGDEADGIGRERGDDGAQGLSTLGKNSGPNTRVLATP